MSVYLTNNNKPITTYSNHALPPVNGKKAALIPFPVASSAVSQKMPSMLKMGQGVSFKPLEEEIRELEIQVNGGLRRLDHNLTGRLTALAALDLKDWIIENGDTANTVVRNGLKFLDNVLPSEWLSDPLLKEYTGNISQVTTIAGMLLKNLDSGSNAAAMICKDKLLKHSRAILAQLKIDYQQKLKDPDQSKASLEAMDRAIRGWEASMRIEEELLAFDKTNIALAASGSLLNTSSTIIKYLPSNPYSALLNQATSVISWGSSIIGLIRSYRSLKAKRGNLQLFNRWSHRFQEWQKQHHDLADRSVDLLQKRQALAKAKIDQLAAEFESIEPKIKELMRKQFERSKDASDFDAWYQKHSKQDLLAFYVDHQETIELTMKNALREMISKKHALEKKFFTFKTVNAAINFSIALLSLMTSGTLAFFGALTTPFAGAGTILLGLSVAFGIISFGLMGGSYGLSFSKKPAKTWALFTQGILRKMVWAELQSKICSYQQRSTEKKLLEAAKTLQALKNSSEGDDLTKLFKALTVYQTAKAAVEKNNREGAKWKGRLDEVQKVLVEKGWEDFAKHASLQNPQTFDTLQRLSEAFQSCDTALLSDETKSLFEVELGIDLAKLKTQMQTKPDAIKKSLQNFFSMDDPKMLWFMLIQQSRMHAGLIQ